MTETSFRVAAALQADWCRVLGAPFTARVCDLLGEVVDRSTATGRRAFDRPGDPVVDALLLRLAGGLNALVRAGDLPGLAAFYPPNDGEHMPGLDQALRGALGDDRLLPWLEKQLQTNEVGRSAVLMPGLLTIAAATGLPCALFELGCSAGLNLRLDRYRYRLGTLDAGPDEAPIVLTPLWEGPPPPAAELRVVARRGVDLMPIDLRAPADRARLLAYVWPEQVERVDRLNRAIAAFVADPVAFDHADAADWVEAEVHPAAGIATVVFHTIAFQYFPEAGQARIAAHMAAMGRAATAAAPLAWLRFELKGADSGTVPSLRLTMWPGGEDRLLATAHPHGASVRWLG